jgi:hypothetical protein
MHCPYFCPQTGRGKKNSNLELERLDQNKSFNLFQLWIAGPKDCGEPRCPISFGSAIFVEGTIDQSNDLCFPNITSDTSEYTKRHGLCALPVAMTPRTPLPPWDGCPIVTPGSDGWPFPNYSWNVEGSLGQVSVQPCPLGQSGNATWTCGLNGQWISFPDLSYCTKIDTTRAVHELNATDSVPSEVIKRLYENVTKEDNIAAGDIKNIIDVLNIALVVQDERLQDAQDPGDYADKYTRESVELMGEILERPETWFGIPITSKSVELTKLQSNLDEVAKSLIKYSALSEHSYLSKSLVVQVRRNLEANMAGFDNDGDIIQVTSKVDLEKGSISFYGITNFGCIVNNRYEW